MDIFQSHDFERLAFSLSIAKSPIDVAATWHGFLKGGNPELCAIVALPEYTKKILPQKRIRTNSAYSNFLVPYFSSEKLYFVDDEIVRSIFANGEAKIKTDHTISFDTNFASHINSVVRGEKIKGGNHEDYGLKHQKKIIQIIENLINDDLNFNHIFYLLENIKLVYPVISKITAPISPLDFWSMLEKDFRRNLVSLELFRGIDCQKYRRTSSPESKFTFQQAARNVIKSAYYFYMSGIGIRGINELLRLQRLSLLYLIGIYKVEFTSTKSQEKERKTEAFFDYIQDVIGIYLDRESIMAHKYFQETEKILFLHQVNKGRLPKNLFDRLDNMAWDMTAPKILELLIASRAQNGFFLAPFFLTLDAKLGDLLRTYTVKAIFINRNNFTTMPIPEINSHDYFYTNGCQYVVDNFFSTKKKTERMKRQPLTITEMNCIIAKEYRSLKKKIGYKE